MLRTFFELMPVFLATVAIIFASVNFNNEHHVRKYSKLISLLSIIAAAILIVAQTSWYVTVVLLDSLQDSTFANYLWTIFNALVMCIIILHNKR